MASQQAQPASSSAAAPRSPGAEPCTSDAEAHTTSHIENKKYPNGQNPRLRYHEPYWFPYRTFAKERWQNRQLLEVISTEFRDRSVEYYVYMDGAGGRAMSQIRQTAKKVQNQPGALELIVQRHALESGVTRINGVIASPYYILRDGDRLDNTVHRHEPPVANDPVKVLHIDREREFVVISKPGSLPVHATGRYLNHTLLDFLKNDFGIHGYAVNRLDRLTSGLMILALSSKASRDLAIEFQNKGVKKEYVARVRGCFPEEEILCDQPLLSVDRQMGLVIVTPEGKEARTIFKRMSYDAERDQSVVRCYPQTGRTHQIRVHLQYLGHPIANDPLYSSPSVWGSGSGKGGIDLEPEEGSSTPADLLAQRAGGRPSASDSTPSLATPGAVSRSRDTPAASGSSIPALRPIPCDSDRLAGAEALPVNGARTIHQQLGPKRDRDTENIEVSSPIRLSKQAKEIIGRLRRMKDEAEDWIRWKEVIFTDPSSEHATTTSEPDPSDPSHPSHGINQRIPLIPNHIAKQPAPKRVPDDFVSPLRKPASLPPGFCPECYVPLPDDPDPETLFIYLHALSYTTERLGKWSTPLPRWAGEAWDGDWRGWVDGAELNGAGAQVSKGEGEVGKEHEGGAVQKDMKG